jgi:hypothetical protein
MTTDLMNDAEREAASKVCETIVKHSLLISPMIHVHLCELQMDTPEDQALVEKMVEMTRPWFEACQDFDALLRAVRERVEGEPTTVEYEVQGNYGHGWECLVTEDDVADARQRLNEYNTEEPQYAHRIKRVKSS